MPPALIPVWICHTLECFYGDAFVHLEVMFAAFGFLYINDSLALLLDDYLCLFIGLSVMSTTM
ncbi:hypothetical protein FACS1894172_14550 [Spirochaetia bacterium]|nr:hypothetical protein FACS1894164_01360 [Spirochaetia bacterium]GHU34379.1 hypothetical protein FACS1894172_14550 [Spirochaetia bacterium]